MMKRHADKICQELVNSGLSKAYVVSRILPRIDAILHDEDEGPDKGHKGYKIGDDVVIGSVLSGARAIIDYDGKISGFQPEHVGKKGVILDFDKKTMGTKDVCVSLDGVPVWGNTSNLLRDK